MIIVMNNNKKIERKQNEDKFLLSIDINFIGKKGYTNGIAKIDSFQSRQSSKKCCCCFSTLSSLKHIIM